MIKLISAVCEHLKHSPGRNTEGQQYAAYVKYSVFVFKRVKQPVYGYVKALNKNTELCKSILCNSRRREVKYSNGRW